MSVQTAPCEWPISYAQCTTEDGLLPEPLASMPASGTFEDMAVEYLWRWTGKVLGLCEYIIKPCRQDCTAFQSAFYGSGPRNGPFAPWTPVIIDGLWYNVGCSLCGDKCGCTGHSPLDLTQVGPVDSVTTITEDGTELDPDTYHVENNALLVRIDGKAWSPCGLEITFKRGVSVPVGGQVAAGVLAVELAKAACGDEDCGLPQRIQAITRQGVTIAILDSFDDVDKGHTGIWVIDSWVASMMKPQPVARVLSPDLPSYNPRRVT